MRTPVSSLATKEALRKTASACPFFSSKARAVRANIFIKAPWLIVRPNRSETMVESNEGQVAEAPKYDSAEVRDETLAKTNDVEGAQATEDVGTKTEQGVRTENKEDGVNIYD